MKENLATLFGFAALVFLTLLVIGFFNPRTALFWSKKPATKKRSARINGLAVVLFFIICSLLAPRRPENLNVKKSIPAETKLASVPDYTFQITHTEREGRDTRLDIVMADLYPREALIEKSRQLKQEYGYDHKLVCYFYYKKYCRMTLPVAGTGYLPDCSGCNYKDKDGNSIDFPFYHLEKALADSLHRITFDTAGFTTETRFFTWGSKSILQIMSSKTADALLVFLGTDGHYATPLLKKTIRGQDRYCDPDEMTSYYVINRADGFVDLYTDKGLDLQSVIED